MPANLKPHIDGPSSHLPSCTARRRIQREHIDYALANKHRMGWQALANICGVNRIDLQQACERGYAGPVSKAEALAASARADDAPAKRPQVDPIIALHAIHRGAQCLEDIADFAECARSHAGKLVTELRTQGLMAGDRRSWTGWLVTKAGVTALQKAGYL